MSTKLPLTPPQLAEAKKMYRRLTNAQLLAHLTTNFGYAGGLTNLRTQLYSHGLKKCHILRWTPAETEFLLQNYTTMGNIAMAKKLSKGKRRFTKKNIEKKMILLGLKRTQHQLQAIRLRHQEHGTYARGNQKMWQTRGFAPNGTIKVQVINKRPVVVIKVKGVFTAYARYRFMQLHGSISPGHKVYLKDNNPLNVEDGNLVEKLAGAYTRHDASDYKKHVKNYMQGLKAPKAPTPTPQPQKQTRPNTVAVRLDRKTVVYVAPGTNIRALKHKLENRARY